MIQPASQGARKDLSKAVCASERNHSRGPAWSLHHSEGHRGPQHHQHGKERSKSAPRHPRGQSAHMRCCLTRSPLGQMSISMPTGDAQIHTEHTGSHTHTHSVIHTHTHCHTHIRTRRTPCSDDLTWDHQLLADGARPRPRPEDPGRTQGSVEKLRLRLD